MFSITAFVVLPVALFLHFGAMAQDGVLTPEARSASRPNILLIMADDMGYAEAGVYGGEIRTPNIDALAKRGVRFSDFYVAPACSPTRAMLMSGVDSHLAGLGNMGELVSGRSSRVTSRFPEIAELVNTQTGKPGYEGYLNFRVNSFPELLRTAGYRTYMAGKWHLGLESDQWPDARGFDRYIAMLEGRASHFSDDWWAVAPNGRAPHIEDGEQVELPVDFYSTTTYVDKMISWIDEDLDSGEQQPFYAWLSFTAPHDPLHVPDEDLDLYAGQYDEGYEVIRDRRVARMKGLGLVGKEFGGTARPPGIPAWEELGDDARRRSARSMEIYAAMVEVMDREIGRLIEYLDVRGVLDNTVVLFMSDNGASGATFQSKGSNIEAFDNGLENMGRPNSFVSYGPGWAQAGSGPFKMFKGSGFEGGVRAPLIVAGPGITRAGIVNAFTHVTDIAPTLLAIAGVMQPADNDRIPMTGRSLLPIFSGGANEVRVEGDAIGWELVGSRGLRQGDWKISYLTHEYGAVTGGKWGLYNLATDPSETKDLAAEEPRQYERLRTKWRDYVQTNGVIVLGE